MAGYEGLKRRAKFIPPAARRRAPEALDRLIELAAATGRPDEAKARRAEWARYASAVYCAYWVEKHPAGGRLLALAAAVATGDARGLATELLAG